MSRWKLLISHQHRRDPFRPLSPHSGPYPTSQCQRHSLVRLAKSSHALPEFLPRVTAPRQRSDRRGWRWRGSFRLPISHTRCVRFRRSRLVLTSRRALAHHSYHAQSGISDISHILCKRGNPKDQSEIHVNHILLSDRLVCVPRVLQYFWSANR